MPLPSSTEPGTGGETKTCIVTGKAFPLSQMIQTEHGWVSAEGKDTYYQCLREGVPFPMAEGQSNARADRKRMVVPMANPKLPMRCVKTNEPVAAENFKHKKLYWCPPLLYLALLANIIIFIILYYIFRKKVKIDIPLSVAGKKIMRKHALNALGVAVLGLGVMIVPLLMGKFGETMAAPMVILGILLVVFALLYGMRKGSTLRVTKLKDGKAWLIGAGKEFLASLPPYP